MTLWLAGARQRRDASVTDRGHEALYDLARLCAFDPADLRVAPLLDHTSPPAVCGGSPGAVGHAFKGLSTDRDGALVCTEREVLVLDRGARPVGRLDHPWFNDLHHAVRGGPALQLAASGLDGIVVLEDPPRFLSFGGGPAPAGDLRTADLKPHRLHPNHLFRAGGDVWATLGAVGRVRRLRDGFEAPLADTVIHDGVEGPDGRIWLTAVDGRLLVFDAARGRLERELALPADGPEPLGWCRGLGFAAGLAWVGFTRIRATRWRRALAWARGRLRGRPVATRRPTRLVGLELDPVRIVAEVPLEPHGLDALFGVDRAPGSISPGA